MERRWTFDIGRWTKKERQTIVRNTCSFDNIICKSKVRKSFMLKIYPILFIIFILSTVRCEEMSNTPKPRTYPRIVYPEKLYQMYNSACPFRFEYPKYGVVERDTIFMNRKAPSDCWFNVKIPSMNAVIHCSYYPIDDKNTFNKLRTDAYELAGKHNVKADYIDELPINKPHHVSGFIFNIEGQAASPFQFYLTDSIHHFLRGALYINAPMKGDSLIPVIEFMKTDVLQMINTFEWK